MYRRSHHRSSSQITLVDEDTNAERYNEDNDNDNDNSDISDAGRRFPPSSSPSPLSSRMSKWRLPQGRRGGGPRNRKFSANKQLQILRNLYRRFSQSNASAAAVGGPVNPDSGGEGRSREASDIDDNNLNNNDGGNLNTSSTPRCSFDSFNTISAAGSSSSTLAPSTLSTSSSTAGGRGNADNNTVPVSVPETIDVLYENQSGLWFFFQPFFSAPGGTPAWMARDFTKSNVDVRNADVPDPSWEWVWPVWYIDMSHDVDEAGWQYSLSFLARHRWHGNHPWYISFVRRRRWLRKRRKRWLEHGKSSHLRRSSATLMFENSSLCLTRSEDQPLLDGDGDGDGYSDDGDFGNDDEYDADISEARRRATGDAHAAISGILASLKAYSTDREKEALVQDFVNSDNEELVDLPSVVSS